MHQQLKNVYKTRVKSKRTRLPAAGQRPPQRQKTQLMQRSIHQRPVTIVAAAAVADGLSIDVDGA